MTSGPATLISWMPRQVCSEMTTRQAAKELGCCTEHVRRLIRSGQLFARVKNPTAARVQYIIPDIEVARYKALQSGRLSEDRTWTPAREKGSAGVAGMPAGVSTGNTGDIK